MLFHKNFVNYSTTFLCRPKFSLLTLISVTIQSLVIFIFWIFRCGCSVMGSLIVAEGEDVINVRLNRYIKMNGGMWRNVTKIVKIITIKIVTEYTGRKGLSSPDTGNVFGFFFHWMNSNLYHMDFYVNIKGKLWKCKYSCSGKQSEKKNTRSAIFSFIHKPNISAKHSWPSSAVREKTAYKN